MKVWIAAVLLCGSAAAQQESAKLTFEVASIRPAKENVQGVRGGCHGIDSVLMPGQTEIPPLGRCVIRDGRLSHMVGIAWNVDMTMVKSGPDWIQRGFDRFNLEAKAEDPAKTTEKQLPQMLQALLVEPGVDRTELTGLYDFTLTWDNEAGPTLETALREQLGLRMQSEKVSTRYFVIDSAQRPSEN